MKTQNRLAAVLVAALPAAAASCAQGGGGGAGREGARTAPQVREAIPPGELAEGRARLAALDPAARDLVREFLNNNCDAGEDGRRLAAILALGPGVEAVFWEAHELGPWPQDVRDLRAAAAKAYESRRAWLRQSGAQALGKDEADRQLAITRDQYVDREVKQYEQRFKTAALAGLGLVGTAESTQRLGRIAADPNDPGQVAAKEALAKMQARR